MISDRISATLAVEATPMSNIADAEEDLKRSLEASFGSDLRGVLVYGRRWDPNTDTEMLRVVVDDATTSEAMVQALPRWIHGIAVKVSRAGAVEM